MERPRHFARHPTYPHSHFIRRAASGSLWLSSPRRLPSARRKVRDKAYRRTTTQRMCTTVVVQNNWLVSWCCAAWRLWVVTEETLAIFRCHHHRSGVPRPASIFASYQSPRGVQYICPADFLLQSVVHLLSTSKRLLRIFAAVPDGCVRSRSRHMYLNIRILVKLIRSCGYNRS